MVGYFYASGFHALYKSLETTKKVRILIGISTDRKTFEFISNARETGQADLPLSHSEVKQELEGAIEKEMEQSEDSRRTEESVAKFMEWIANGKLEVRAYPSEKIHAKVYIMTFTKEDRDKGRVITGSSNFTQAGLVDNLEFNVELKNRADYDFALSKFNELWEDAVDVSQKYVETIRNKTWFNDTISPYELYLKFLYEYFKGELSQSDEVFMMYLPPEFKKLDYQEQAVLNAKKILEEYGGVFISDVVGLGKTYISAMLAGQLEGRTLVIAPPVLLDKTNPGAWPNVFADFRVPASFESVGKLDKLIASGVEKYQNIIIDEAHRFRTDSNVTFEKLAQICRGKRVVLVTATPYNNSPKDILAQIKLFQKTRKSTIPNLPDLEKFFSGLEKRLKNLDRQNDYAEYIKTVKANAKEIRDKVLKYLMVRRTRSEIMKYFADDLEKQNLRFPEVEKPEAFFYELNENEDAVFTETIVLVAQRFKYARYTPLLYYEDKEKLTQPEELSQKNMGKFMKILLIKRLESSFYAFRKSLERFIHSYEQFLEEFDRGNVYVSKKHASKIFELLEDEDEEGIERLLAEDKAQRYDSEDFTDDFRKDLQGDLDILRRIHHLWGTVTRDPKLDTFIRTLVSDPHLDKGKLIVFTESRETAEYLTKNLEVKLPMQTLCFTGKSGAALREKVIENFDAKAKVQKDAYRLLITTEVLSEGVNLHRSNVVINYDIPWNPTRMMQRVGRINRVDTEFSEIYTFNFFPTKQSNDQIKLKEAAEAKINAFISLLGADAQLLTEGEPIEQHELFDRLTSKSTVTGEDGEEESELKYLNVIKTVRDNEPGLFERIKRLPKKARTARSSKGHFEALVTYFRQGKLQKFFLSGAEDDGRELGFLEAAPLIETEPDTQRRCLSEGFYELLEKNKRAFLIATTEEAPDMNLWRGRDTAGQVLKILKAVIRDRRRLTEDQEVYLKRVVTQLEEGGLPKNTSKETLKALKEELKRGINPLRIIAVLRTCIPDSLLEGHAAEVSSISASSSREVILSELLIAD